MIFFSLGLCAGLFILGACASSASQQESLGYKYTTLLGSVAAGGPVALRWKQLAASSACSLKMEVPTEVNLPSYHLP